MAPDISPRRPETEDERKQRIQPLIDLRMKKREEWDAYWKVFDLESRGRAWKRYQYCFWRTVDIPVTLWRENVIEPLHDKFGHWPYYHRRFRRVPTIDECRVNDSVCYHEAQQQYRLDKLVDNKILDILRTRREDCMAYHDRNMVKCQQQMEDLEEAELNWYIKYGELGYRGDVLTCYTKQKHRMVWERRNPEVMAERQKAYDEHKRLLKLGIYDHWFWKRGEEWMYKDYRGSMLRRSTINPHTLITKDEEGISLDPDYYRQRKEDAGKTKIASAWEVYP